MGGRHPVSLSDLFNKQIESADKIWAVGIANPISRLAA